MEQLGIFERTGRILEGLEGIFSEDGKIFGKMGHSERYEKGLFQNIAGNKDQDIFANGVRYFTHKQVK